MSEDTLEALSSITFCPICGEHGVILDQALLYRVENDKDGYRKRREIFGRCTKCAELGRGDVRIQITQRF